MMTTWSGIRKAQEALALHPLCLRHVEDCQTQAHHVIEKETFACLRMMPCQLVYVFQIYKGKDEVNLEDFDCVQIATHF